MINKEILRYLDLFGTKCSFYTEQRLKLYTPLGGILSITSLSLAVFIFTYLNFRSFKREDPTIITSSIIEEQHKIKFNEEKIWIPWKISNHRNKYFNHSEILFPIIKYYYRENNNEHLKSKELSYKLCNETSMVNNSNNILIESSLEQLYCIDMDDLYMGGSWHSNFIYFVEFNLYICKNGINYDENNSNCTSFDILNNYNNSLNVYFYYPTIQFQERDFKSPIKIKYYKNYVILSQNVSKIDTLFLQKTTLYDNFGFFKSKVKIHNYWGFSSKNRDFYSIYNSQNISTSKLYSFIIFIESNNINYTRIYKNIFIILSQSLPLISLIHSFLKLIAKLFKLSSINRKMTELLFENLTEKHSKYENYIEDIKKKKNSKNKIKNNKTTEDNNIINLTNKDYSKNLQNVSTFSLFRKKENNQVKILLRKKSNSPIINHKTISINEKNPKNDKNFRINSINFKNLNLNKNLSLKYKEPVFPKKKRFVANKLFPFRYYFCPIFLKNLDITPHSFCMSRKFIKVYNFLCQLFDISSYCILQREFNIVKNTIFDEKNIKLIEKKSKINVNSQSFIRDMNDCIGSNKFHILGKHTFKSKISEKF